MPAGPWLIIEISRLALSSATGKKPFLCHSAGERASMPAWWAECFAGARDGSPRSYSRPAAGLRRRSVSTGRARCCSYGIARNGRRIAFVPLRKKQAAAGEACGASRGSGHRLRPCTPKRNRGQCQHAHPNRQALVFPRSYPPSLACPMHSCAGYAACRGSMQTPRKPFDPETPGRKSSFPPCASGNPCATIGKLRNGVR